ncbi:MFS transporter [Acinetobacter sp. CAAS 2-6]|uniref:MFS transporter n=1 Tax=Acinetobacter sp. CAAS 2-6 TaxID=3016358 RepID=UPI002DD6AB36|nr:MFS transporter [Acinetobacter sp. CAAS 2-6]
MSDPIPYIARGSKAFSAILIALFFAGFTSFSVLYCVQPMMPIFAQYFQISPTQSSFPLSLSTVALAVGLLFTGMISDRFGRKPIMLWALLLCSSLTILSSFVQVWPLYLLFRVLIGLCVSGVAAVAMTYIGEEIAREDLAFAMGLYISGTAVGGMSGRLLAGVMIDFLSWQQATLIIGLLNFCLAIAFWKLLPNSRHFSAYPMHFSRFIQSFAHNLADRKLRILFVQAFILMGCFVTIFNYMSYHLLEAPFQLSQTWIGLISIVYLAGIYSSPRAAAWSRCFGREKVLPVMLCSMIAGLGIMMLNQIWLIFIGLLIFTFSFFAAHSTASAWVSVQAVQYRAVASSLYLFCYYLGSSILGSSSGVVWENFGWHGIGTEISLILVFGLLLAVYLARGSRT